MMVALVMKDEFLGNGEKIQKIRETKIRDLKMSQPIRQADKQPSCESRYLPFNINHSTKSINRNIKTIFRKSTSRTPHHR